MSEVADDGSVTGLVRLGLGGAMLGSLQGGKEQPTNRPWADFIGCSFTNNSGYEGGAVAMVDVDATFENCTFHNNTAGQGGDNVYNILGGALELTGSNIELASPSVDWQRATASQCLRGEYFTVGLCRRCAPSTYSLQMPSNSCLPCPLTAKVCGRVQLNTMPTQAAGATCVLVACGVCSYQPIRSPQTPSLPTAIHQVTADANGPSITHSLTTHLPHLPVAACCSCVAVPWRGCYPA